MLVDGNGIRVLIMNCVCEGEMQVEMGWDFGIFGKNQGKDRNGEERRDILNLRKERTVEEKRMVGREKRKSECITNW